MFVISVNAFFTITYFGPILYLFLVSSLMLYYLPIISKINTTFGMTKAPGYFLGGGDVIFSMSGSFFCLFLLFVTRYGVAVELGAGHFTITDSTLKLTIFILLIFALFFLILSSIINFYAREIFDFCVSCVQFCLGFILLFGANSIFAVFFIFEILATLVFLLLVTSCFSATGNYRRESLATFAYFAPQLPNFYVNSLLFFFGMSMLASVGLFFFTFHFIVLFYSFEGSLAELLFIWQVSTISTKEFLTQTAAGCGLLLCLFIKCGVTPFFVGKPAFFKGIPTITVFFYTACYYFFLLLFIFYFLSTHVNAIFHGFAYLNLALLSLGMFITGLIFTEVTYLKPFFAFSSIINTLFMFSGLIATSVYDLIVFY